MSTNTQRAVHRVKDALREGGTLMKMHNVNHGRRVCDEWRSDFTAFVAHMGEHPGDEFEIDRINPFGNYEPSNVRWASRAEGRRNKRKNWRGELSEPEEQRIQTRQK